MDLEMDLEFTGVGTLADKAQGAEYHHGEVRTLGSQARVPIYITLHRYVDISIAYANKTFASPALVDPSPTAASQDRNPAEGSGADKWRGVHHGGVRTTQGED